MKDLGLATLVRPPEIFELYEHFGSAAVAATALDNFAESSSAAGTNTKQAGGLYHPGVLRLTTGATSGNNKRLHLGSAANDANFNPALFDRFRWVVRIPTITTITIRLGLMVDVSAADGGTAGAYFDFDPAVSANWRMVTRQGASSTANNAATVAANNWYALEARRLASGSWEFWINEVLRFTHSATLPSTSCAFGCLVQTGAAAARSVDLDLAYARATLGQVFT